MKSGWTLAGMALFWAASASAQHPTVIAKLDELNAKAPQPSAEEITRAMIATAKARGDALGTCVPDAIVLGDIAPVTGARDVLQGVLAGQLRNGWTAYATHQGCPVQAPIRYMLLQKSDGALLAFEVNEGVSLANPTIMRDTSAQAAVTAYQSAKRLDPACDGKDMAMGPTRVTSRSEDLGPEIYGARYVGSWTETWRLTVCGRSFDVPVEFRADGDGGAYTKIDAKAVALVP